MSVHSPGSPAGPVSCLCTVQQDQCPVCVQSSRTSVLCVYSPAGPMSCVCTHQAVQQDQCPVCVQSSRTSVLSVHSPAGPVSYVCTVQQDQSSICAQSSRTSVLSMHSPAGPVSCLCTVQQDQCPVYAQSSRTSVQSLHTRPYSDLRPLPTPLHSSGQAGPRAECPDSPVDRYHGYWTSLLYMTALALMRAQVSRRLASDLRAARRRPLTAVGDKGIHSAGC